jgi:energy-coupling factor transporter ATP-binding protein EcfA2
MPGFPRGGFRIDDLCSGVNIVYGPNASGKTTLGRAIRRLLRPEDKSADRYSLWTLLELNGTDIELDYDAGSVRCRRRSDGVNQPCPKLAPPELGDRHVLALQDLIRSEEDSDLAGEIVKELAGGYDVSAARNSLGYREGPSRKAKPAQEFAEADREYREAVRRQDALLEKEKSLAQLEAEKTAAREARARLGVIEKALEYVASTRQAADIQSELDGFPAAVARITEHDVVELDRLKASLAECGRRRDIEEQKRNEAVRTQQDCGLPEEGLSAELITSLRSKCQRLAGLSGEIHRGEDTAARVASELKQAREAIGPNVDPLQAAQIDTGWVEEQFRFAHRAEKLRAEKTAADAMRDWLGADQRVDNVETLHEAIVLLRRWLGAEQSDSGREDLGRRAPLIGGSVMGVLSVVMIFVFHWSWILGLIASAALVGWCLWRGKQPQVDRQLEFRREYEGLGIAPPEDWSTTEVSAHLRQLQATHAEAALAKEKATRWGGLSDRVDQLAKDQEALDEERLARIDRLGVDATADQAGLAVLADNIRRHQQARQKEEAALASLDKVRDDYGVLLDEINAAVSSFGMGSVADADAASARIDNLDNRRQQYDLAAKTAQQCQDLLSRLDTRIQDENGQLAALFHRVGLTVDDEHELRRLVKFRKPYDAVTDSLRVAEHAIESAGKALEDHPELLEMTTEELTRLGQELGELADRLSAVSQEIGGIESEIAAAKRGSDLEVLLARRDEALDQLRRRREADYRSVSGHVLADYVSRQQREEEEPRVLRRARELFTRITHGRYELSVHEADPPEFRAKDTSENRGLALDELSSGTRLQLLLAARVAFVEQQEQAVKVPLILDETLANSDERRASDIIKAVIEICCQGRQVFYFTAQQDEVGKWRRLLRESGQVEYHEVDLAEVRQFSETERVPPVEFDPPKPDEVPSPDGLDWAAYGSKLKVPDLDPNGESGNIHLWYLIQDLPTLYRLLKNGVNRWGQLQSLVNHSQAEGIGPDSQVYQEAQVAVRVLEEAAREWRIGRGNPIDRAVLIDSGAVSDTYLDRVSRLASEHSGDAKQLIAALESGRVKGFLSKKREALHEYLTSEGYLDEREFRTPEEIRDRVHPTIFADMEKGLISLPRFEQLLAMIVG